MLIRCPECGSTDMVLDVTLEQTQDGRTVSDWHVPSDARCNDCDWTGDDTDLS